MSIIDEIKSYFGCGSSGKALAHYGTPRHSGRYPWGVEKIRFNIAEIFYLE